MNAVEQKLPASATVSSITLTHRSVDDQDAKPLPRLPRGWSRICHETGLFLRTMGLGILVSTYRGIFDKKFVEPTKVAIIKNRFSASLRSLIHALPVAIAIMEITMNWKGYYVGMTFDKQTYLQFAAKAHEIVIQASLATTLLAYLRHGVTQGVGIPFGALLGGIQFFQLSYLWSLEFWSSIMSVEFRKVSKLSFMLMAIVCTFIASTAGPSSATLLIPQLNLWSVPPFRLSLNGTFDTFWPNSTDGLAIPNDCATLTSESSPTNLLCPLSNMIPNLKSASPVFDVQDTGQDVDEMLVIYTDANFGTSNYEKTIFLSACSVLSQNQACATSPQEAFYPSMTNAPPIGAKGFDDAYDFDFLASYLTIQDDYFQPYTVSSCVRSVVNETMGRTPLRFALLGETQSDLERVILPVPDFTVERALHMSGNRSQYRTAWVDLPQTTFKTRVPGVIIVHPQELTDSANITTCTLDAGWGSSRLMGYNKEDTDLFSSITDTTASHHADTMMAEDSAGFVQQGWPAFGVFSGAEYPERRLQSTQSWISFLNPTLQLTPSQNSTVIDLFLAQAGAGQQPSENYVAFVMSFLLTNGLSRIGAATDFNVVPSGVQGNKYCDGCLSYEIQRSIYGWSYQINGVATKLAIIVMIAYCILATGHTLYAIISGVSSSAWDSVAELIALAMNSEPTHFLQNTCAGMIGIGVFKTPVRILETRDGHLELCFGSGRDLSTSKLKVNEKYGRIEDGNKIKED